MGKKSFANRLILNFTCVIFVGFLAVYFLFNSLMDTHIRSEAEAELSQEIMTVNQFEFIPTVPILEFNSPDGSQNWTVIRNGHMRRDHAIVNVDTIVIDHQLRIIHPTPQSLSEAEITQVEALANFWNDHQYLFEASDDMILVTHEGRTFYMRATAHYVDPAGQRPFEIPPVFVLMYTDITPAMNLKNSMNQVLLALLATSGTLTFAISIILSTRFKKTIKRLSEHAQIIGQGQLETKITNLDYAEFSDLGESMNNMAEMLGTYEASQKQFFQNASHELRTPLMSIQGYAEGLNLGVFSHHHEATDVILEESAKMTALINDILYLSKLGVNSELNLSPISVDDLVTTCIERVQILATKSSKKLVIHPIDDVEITTDIEKLERAILNILSNGIRYATTEIQIDCTAQNGYLTLKITNDGPCIREKDLPYLFDRFFKGSRGNTGLGLAITKDIVMKLGGNVSCGNLDDGVYFVIDLPI